MLTSDEEYAVDLQRKFDDEERKHKETEQHDRKIALALSLGHDISGSEDEDDVGKWERDQRSGDVCNQSSDSDDTFVEELEKDRMCSLFGVNKSTLEISDSESDGESSSHRKMIDKKGKKLAKGKHALETLRDEVMIGVGKKQANNHTKTPTNSGFLQSSYRIPKKATTTEIDQDGRQSKPPKCKLEEKLESRRNKATDTQPRCKYGKQCIRKNPQHHQEYYHTDSSEDENDHSQSRKRKNDDDDGLSSKRKRTEHSHQQSSENTLVEVLESSTPFFFLLTKVHGISSKFNNYLAVHISEILSPVLGNLEASVQFNYVYDIEWLMQQYHPKFRSKPALLVHGEQRESKNALHEVAAAYPNVRLCQARLDIMYGTHHSKMMILLYTEGLRVVVHTANLVKKDWHQKSQGVWISPLFPKLNHSHPTPQMGNSTTNFKVDLLDYIAAYKSKPLLDWRDHLLEHDMTEARVRIIASVPGRHQGENKMKWGHMKMRKILKEHGPEVQQVKQWSVVGQFSSVGSLGPDKNKWLCGEWLQSLSTCNKSAMNSPPPLKLIFPSVNNVRLSLEGYPAGASVPYSSRTASKQQYFNQFLHQWWASDRGRNRACPHIKTYTRLSPDQSHIPWFLVTSANMSKAAWGAMEKKETQLMIRSYEIGVLFIPKDFEPSNNYFRVGKSGNNSEEPHFPIPWDVPLKPYEQKDQPWIWDIPHTEKPDCNGNAWVPS